MSALPSACVSVYLSASLPSSLPAQAPLRAEGRVVRVTGTDTAGVARARVVLHRVGRQIQGSLDSAVTDRAGRFRFRFTADTSSIYLLSARFAGIEYFSPPVHTNPSRPDTAITVFVSDTSSLAPIAVEARHLVVSAPSEDGTRNVLDLVVLRITGDETRVAPDTVQPSWAMPFPSEAIGLNVGEGDFSPQAVARRGDSLVVFAPIAPGTKQLTVQYSLPADVTTFEVPFGPAAEAVNVLLEEDDARVAGGTLAPADSQVIEGRAYHRWAGAAPAGSLLRISLPEQGRADQWVLAALVGAVGLVLIGATWRVLQRRQERPAPGGASQAESLIDAVARLDAQYLGREGEVSSEDWQRYRAERQRLMVQLEAALPTRGSQ